MRITRLDVLAASGLAALLATMAGGALWIGADPDRAQRWQGLLVFGSVMLPLVGFLISWWLVGRRPEPDAIRPVTQEVVDPARAEQERLQIAGELRKLKEQNPPAGRSLPAHLGRTPGHVNKLLAGTVRFTSWGQVEDIATHLGAPEGQLRELRARWYGEPISTPAPVPDRRGSWRVPVAVLTVVGLFAGAVALYAVRKSDSGTFHVPEESWKRTPSRIAPEFFGVTTVQSSGDMPSFDVGSVRLWDSRTRWSNLQPARDRYEWIILDAHVTGAEAKKLPILLTFGGTPAWAAPGGKSTPYDDRSTTVAPEDLDDWVTFVHRVAKRYKGHIHAYELWNNMMSPRSWTGTVEEMVELVTKGASAIRAEDPDATIVCPGMGELWNEQALRKLDQFMKLGGYEPCDYAAVKIFPPDPTDAPEKAIELWERVDRLWRLNPDVGERRLWNTGTHPDVATAPQFDQQKQADYAVRFYLAGIYAHLDRTYFYPWGTDKAPIVLQPVGQQPTQAALAVQTLQSWISGKYVTSCGRGNKIKMPPHVWRCTFQPTPFHGDPDTFSIVWTDRGTQEIPVNSFAQVRSLDGQVRSVSDGESVTVSESPLLLE